MGAGSSEGASDPSTADRHSLPYASPRIGTAHERQRGRPHDAHHATEALAGWTEHRSEDLTARSSTGTVSSLRSRLTCLAQAG